MPDLTIHRGSHQIGGCSTEINIGDSRILIDFGANLPGTDEASETKDNDMARRVFGSCQGGGKDDPVYQRYVSAPEGN